jgi:glucosyl-dolichyl phosphate glucuronosyltransferase
VSCITAAIVTWNRAKLLDLTLAQMQKLRIPPGVEWELLIVNNGCTDETDEVIAKHGKFLPIRGLFEATPGCASARNKAVAEARGELILWIDDDVLADPEWLAAHHEAAQRWPDAAYFGGLIEPWFERTPPGWILANRKMLEGVLALRDFGDDEHYLSADEIPWTANMAIRAEIFRDSRFDPALGVTRNGGYLSAETELVKSLHARGVPGVWVPGARVKHFISKRRLNRGYVWKHFHRYGRTLTYLTRSLDHLNGATRAGKEWDGVPRWVYRRCIEMWATSLWKRIRFQPDWLRVYTGAATTAGAIAEARRQHKEGRPRGDEAHPVVASGRC